VVGTIQVFIISPTAYVEELGGFGVGVREEGWISGRYCGALGDTWKK
jgi:hypothetical protein